MVYFWNKHDSVSRKAKRVGIESKGNHKKLTNLLALFLKMV